jgi:hypothetical protein
MSMIRSYSTTPGNAVFAFLWEGFILRPAIDRSPGAYSAMRSGFDDEDTTKNKYATYNYV